MEPENPGWACALPENVAEDWPVAAPWLNDEPQPRSGRSANAAALRSKARPGSIDRPRKTRWILSEKKRIQRSGVPIGERKGSA